MFNHVLVPVVPEHVNAYEEAMAVAKRLKTGEGKVSVLSILEAVPTYVSTYLPEDYLKQNATKLSDRLKEAFAAEAAEVHIIAGHSATSILEWANAHDVDCIVLNSHQPGLSDLLIGSTAAKVVRHAKCAVVVLR